MAFFFTEPGRDGDDHLVAAAGQLFVQGFVEYEGRTGRFDDVIGQGFVVMAADADPARVLNQTQLTFLDRIEARLVQVSSAYKPGPEVVADLRGTYSRWFRERGLRAVVMRPDYYLFGTAANLEDLPAVVDSLQHQLHWHSRQAVSADAIKAPHTAASLGP